MMSSFSSSMCVHFVASLDLDMELCLSFTTIIELWVRFASPITTLLQSAVQVLISEIWARSVCSSGDANDRHLLQVRSWLWYGWWPYETTESLSQRILQPVHEEPVADCWLLTADCCLLLMVVPVLNKSGLSVLVKSLMCVISLGRLRFPALEKPKPVNAPWECKFALWLFIRYEFSILLWYTVIHVL